jgi:hypothetical protein
MSVFLTPKGWQYKKKQVFSCQLDRPLFAQKIDDYLTKRAV